MSEPQQTIALGKLEWGVIASLLISACSAIFSAGIVYGAVQDHEKRLVRIESRSDTENERLARIESKLEFLVDQYRREK
jgi:hypothetical protein